MVSETDIRDWIESNLKCDHTKEDGTHPDQVWFNRKKVEELIIRLYKEFNK